MRTLPITRFVAVILPAVLMLCLLSCSADDPQHAATSQKVLAPTAGAALLRALDPGPQAIFNGEFLSLENLSQDRSSASFRYILGNDAFDFRLAVRTADCPDGAPSREFCVRPKVAGNSALSLADFAATRLDSGDVAFWIQPASSPPEQDPDSHQFSGWFLYACACWALLALALLLSLPGVFARRSCEAWQTDLILVSASAGIRLLMATFGPGDLVSVEFSNLFRGGESQLYGPGPDPLLLPLIHMMGNGDRTVVVVNLLLGSLCPSLLLGFLRRIPAIPEINRIAAAILLVFLPLPVRYAGEFNRTTLVLFLSLLCLASYAQLLTARRFGTIDLIRRLATVVAAVSLTAMIRPEGGLILLPLCLLLLTNLDSPGRLRSLAALTLAAAAFGLFYLESLSVNPVLMNYTARTIPFSSRLTSIFNPANQTWLDPGFTPAAWILLSVMGIFRFLRRRDPFGSWALFCLVGLGFYYAIMPTGQEGIVQLASARYQTLAAIPLAILVAEGAAPIIARDAGRPLVVVGIGRILMTILTVLSVLQATRSVTGPTDIDYEYLLLREWLPELPKDSEIHYVHGAGGRRQVFDVSLRPPEFLSFLVNRPDITWHDWPFDPGTPGQPRFFLLPSVCTEADVMLRMTGHDPALADVAEACTQASRAASPVPFRFQNVPYRRFLDSRTGNGVIPIGLFPLPDPRIASPDGSSGS
jgi:hypothetical protein